MTLTGEQIRQTLTSPIVYIGTKIGSVDPQQENFLYCSPSFADTAFQGTIIVDSKGTTFKIKKVTLTGGLLFWLSIKHVCAIKEVLPEIDGDITTISLPDFKDLIIQTIGKGGKKQWAALDTVKNISRDVNNCQTYKDVMKIFHLGIR